MRNENVTIYQRSLVRQESKFEWTIPTGDFVFVREAAFLGDRMLYVPVGKRGFKNLIESGVEENELPFVLDHDSGCVSGGTGWAGETWIVAKDFAHPSDRIPKLGKLFHRYGFRLSERQGLHRDFAAMPRTPEGVSSFIRSNGFLGLNTVLLEVQDLGWVWGEAVSEYIAEAHKMSVLIGLWDKWQAGVWDCVSDEESDDCEQNASEARELTSEPPVAYFDIDLCFIHSDFYIAEQATSGNLSEEFDLPYVPPDRDTKGLYNRAAEAVLQGHLKLAIQETCVPDFTLKKGDYIRLFPKNLLGAMYSLLLDEVIGYPDPVFRCLVCGKHLTAYTGKEKYCSTACRMKAYRRRKKSGK